jgi:putative ABC transport system permease protein
VRAIVADVDRDLPVVELRRMDRGILEHLTALRFAAYMMLGFAALALLLSCIGVYAVISYAVSERTHEIGIRMALGAPASNVRGSVLLRTAKLIAAGLALGLIASIAFVRVLSTFLYGVAPTDWTAYAIVVATFSAVGLVAAYLPARRAMNVDPMIALRQL